MYLHTVKSSSQSSNHSGNRRKPSGSPPKIIDQQLSASKLDAIETREAIYQNFGIISTKRNNS